jgi:hypothetical protein
MLEPVGRALTPEAARRLVAIKSDDETQARIDALADGANEGTLTSDERVEYESLIAAAGVVSLLQAKARSVLSNMPA